MIDTDEAIDVFVEAYAYTRSFIRPVEVTHRGPLQVIRDVPGGKKEPRKEEIAVPPGVKINQVLDALADYHPPGGYRLDVFATTEPKSEITPRYKQHGYHYIVAEPLLALDLACVHRVKQAHRVWRIQTQDEIERVLKASRERLCRPEHLAEQPSTVRAYYVEKDGHVVAWGRSIQRRKEATYVAGLYTVEAYRRQGIASALMQRLLADDADAGARYSVLLASGQGHPLYVRLGYVLLGWLYLFTIR